MIPPDMVGLAFEAYSSTALCGSACQRLCSMLFLLSSTVRLRTESLAQDSVAPSTTCDRRALAICFYNCALHVISTLKHALITDARLITGDCARDITLCSCGEFRKRVKISASYDSFTTAGKVFCVASHFERLIAGKEPWRSLVGHSLAGLNHCRSSTRIVHLSQMGHCSKYSYLSRQLELFLVCHHQFWLNLWSSQNLWHVAESLLFKCFFACCPCSQQMCNGS